MEGNGQATAIMLSSSGSLSSNSSDKPDTSKVLDQLKFDIDQLRAERTRPGWTLWALVGSLSAIGFSLIDRLPVALKDPQGMRLSIVSLTVLIECCQEFHSLLTTKLRSARPSLRFLVTNDLMAMARPQLAVLIIRDSILLILAAQLGGGTGLTASVFFAFRVLLWLVALVLSFVRWPVPLTHQGGKAAIATAVTLAIGAYTLWLAQEAVRHSVSSISPDVIRAGALIVAGIFVLQWLAAWPTQIPLLNELGWVRRELAFGRISVEKAIEQAEIILIGLRASDVVQSDLEQTLAAFDRKHEAIRAGMSIATALEDNLRDLRPDSPPQKKAATEAILVAMKNRITAMREAQQLVNKKLDRLKKQLLQLARLQPEAVDEIRLLIDRLSAASEPGDKLVAELEQRVNASRDLVEQHFPGR